MYGVVGAVSARRRCDTRKLTQHNRKITIYKHFYRVYHIYYYAFVCYVVMYLLLGIINSGYRIISSVRSVAFFLSLAISATFVYVCACASSFNALRSLARYAGV